MTLVQVTLLMSVFLSVRWEEAHMFYAVGGHDTWLLHPSVWPAVAVNPQPPGGMLLQSEPPARQGLTPAAHP